MQVGTGMIPLPLNLSLKYGNLLLLKKKVYILIKSKGEIEGWEKQISDIKNEVFKSYKENKVEFKERENEFCEKIDEIINIGKQRFGLLEIKSNDKQKEEFNVEQTNQNEHKLTDSWTKLKTVELEHSGYNMNKPKIRTNRVGYTELT